MAKKIFCLLVLGFFLAGYFHTETALALYPPSAQQIEQYRLDGTLESRISQARQTGNFRFDENLVCNFRQKMKELRKGGAVNLQQDGAGLTTMSLPPARTGGLPAAGSPKVFVLLIDFPDVPHTANQTQADIESKFFGDGNPLLFPYESVRNYYRRSSYNQLNIQGTVFAWYTARYNRVSYTGSRENLITEAVNYFDSQGHDFSQYDNDGDGTIDAFYVEWTGGLGDWATFWWAGQMRWQNDLYRVDGKKLNKYVWSWASTSPGHVYEPDADLFCTGNLLGLPCLYDANRNEGPKGGAGGIDMMDGRGDHNCFSKFMLGWVTPAVVNAGSYAADLGPSETSPDCVMIMPGADVNDTFNEFFMVQYRKRYVGNDGYFIPASGLYIWHINAILDASGTDFLFDNAYAPLKLIRLMEADGLEEIEQELGCNAGDIYVSPAVFGPRTFPNSKNYANFYTGITVNNLGTPDATMHADFAILPRTYDLPELTLLAQQWLRSDCLPPDSCQGMDYTGNGSVDVEDLELFADHWLTIRPLDGMVFIPGGEFQMGDSFAEGSADELPVHSVNVNSFFMHRFEITNQQYCDFLNYAYPIGWIGLNNSGVYEKSSGNEYVYCQTNPTCSTSQIQYHGSVTLFNPIPGKANLPMTMVTWYGAAAYANWLSVVQGLEPCYDDAFIPDLGKQGYRLPTEAEWEYAARGGLAGNRYPWGNNIAANQANYSSSGDPYEAGANPWTTPVGFYNGQLHDKTVFNWPGTDATYQTAGGMNGYGLFDMAGNLWEWCNDWYSSTYYSTSPYDNPPGPVTGTDHVIRGGRWLAQTSNLRVARRRYVGYSPLDDNSGFRVVFVTP